MRRLAFALVLFGSAAAHAAHGVRLTWYGDPTTSIGVAWNSDDPNDGQLVWGTSPGALTNTVTAAAATQPAPLGHLFTVELSGLSPGTTYYYRVGGAGGVLHPDAASPPFQFRTRDADKCAPFTFILIGDNRADFDGMGANPLWQDILNESLVHAPDFYVNTGDMVKNGERADEWVSFIDDSEPGWAVVPSLLTMGNHDEDQVHGDGALYNQLYVLPRNSATGTEDYYSLDVGPIHFVSLSSQFNNPGSIDMTQMVSWLAADLAATTQPWKIVFFHKAVYSRGNHSSGEENGGAINAQFIPIFDQYDVDFVFNGHSHNYERYVPSVGVDAAFGGSGRTFPAGTGSGLATMVPDGATGTTYMVSGGAGALTTDVFGFTCVDAACTYCTGFNINCDGGVYDKDVEGNVIYEGRHNFAVLEVDADVITVKVYATEAGNSSGGMLEQFTMTKSAFPIMCGATGTPDAGPGPGNIDARVDPVDAGAGPNEPDAGSGGQQVGDESGGCGCATARPTSPPLLLGWCAGLALLFRVKRWSGRRPPRAPRGKQ